MATIVFFPYPEFGHLNPPLKLGRALKQRGHCVYYLGLPDFEDYIRSQGIEYISVFGKRCPKGYLKQRAKDKIDLDLDNFSLIALEATGAKGAASFNLLKEVEREFSEVVSEVRPDLLIVDFKLRDLAAVTVTKFGLLTAILSVTLIDLAPLSESEDHAVPSSELPELFLCPKEFDFPSHTKPNRYYIEASVDLDRKEPHTSLWNELDESRPLIYCSLGSQPHQYDKSESLFRSIIQAMRERPEWQLVLAVGAHLRVTDFQPLPPNALVVSWAPQLRMLGRAAMMITHGGLGAVKECIYFGVPMIMLPCRWDQPHNAARATYHGLGVRGDINDISSERIHALIDILATNSSFKRRIEAMSSTFRQIEDSGIGVSTVEKILSDSRHRQPSQLALSLA